MEKKTPQRMCIACREMHDKRDLIRVVRSPDGEISLDFSGKKNGRGAYLCNSLSCIEKCSKAKLLSKTFKQDVDAAVYVRLIEEYKRANG